MFLSRGVAFQLGESAIPLGEGALQPLEGTVGLAAEGKNRWVLNRLSAIRTSAIFPAQIAVEVIRSPYYDLEKNEVSTQVSLV
jgi:hypothetical protein